MANIMIASGKYIDEANALSATSESAYPVTNLQNLQPTKIWRNSSTSATIDIDLGSARTVTMAALLHTNLSATATWRVHMASSQARLGNSDYIGAVNDFFDGNDRDSWDRISGVNVFASSKTYQWMRLVLSDASNVDGYLEAGRVFADNAWIPSINMHYNWSLGYKDDSRHTPTIGGQTIVTARGTRREIKFELGHLTEAEMYDNAFDLDRNRGSSKDILVVKDYENTTYVNDQIIHGTSRTLQPIINERYGIFKKRYLVTELT